MRPALRSLVQPNTISVDLVSTPLMAARVLSAFADLLFSFENLDATNSVDVLIETSEDGTRWDGEHVYTLSTPAGVQRSLQIQGNMRDYWRVSGTATGAAVNVSWSLKAEPRVALAGGRMWLLAVLLPLALAACHVPQAEDRWKTDWRGFEPLAGYDCTLEAAHRRIPCDLRWSGRVSWWPCPFKCGWPPAEVWGCMPAGAALPVFAVCYRDPVWTTALAHELGHYVLSACSLPSDEGTVQAWAGEVNAIAQVECGVGRSESAGGAPWAN
jgi:hypothetical protein